MRNLVAQPSLHFVSSVHASTAVVAVDANRVPHAWLRIPSGALATQSATASIRISPVPQQTLQKTKIQVDPTRQNTFNTTLSFEQIVLSPAFSCSAGVLGALPLPLTFEAHYDLSPSTSVADICLGRLVDASTWACVTPTEWGNLSNVWANDGRPARLLSGTVTECQSNVSAVSWIYAFILSPAPVPQPPVASTSSWFDQNKGALLGGLIGGCALAAAMAYVGWRLYRYKRKYEEQKKKGAELEARKDEIDEKEGGLGIAGDDITMVANPLVVEIRDLEEQLATVNRQMGGEASQDRRRINELTAEQNRLK